MPGDDSIEAKPGNLLERDTTTIVDVFSTYGRVFYTNGLTLDRPLDIIRNGYTHSTDTTFNSWAGAVAVISHTDWRGQMDLGTFATGGVVGDIATAGTYCRTPPGLGTVCMVVDWPAGFQGIFNEYHAPYGPRSWFGSLTLNKQDGSGFQYSRNRYYDPSTGRFTQEDPIGIAGGLNAYGFANGNPISYSDPFGLCIEDACIVEGLITAGVALAPVVEENAPALSEDAAAITEQVSEDAAGIAERAHEIHDAVAQVTRDKTTIAVARVEDAEGKIETWVASSEAKLRPVQQSLLSGKEQAIQGAGHAEQTIVNAVKATGRRLHEIAASRPICPACADAIRSIGGIISSALKQ